MSYFLLFTNNLVGAIRVVDDGRRRHAGDIDFVPVPGATGRRYLPSVHTGFDKRLGLRLAVPVIWA